MVECGRKSWAAPPGTTETLPFRAGCLETGAWPARGLQDGDLGRRGQSDPILLSGGASELKAFSPFMFSVPCPPSPRSSGGFWPEIMAVLNR